MVHGNALNQRASCGTFNPNFILVVLLVLLVALALLIRRRLNAKAVVLGGLVLSQPSKRIGGGNQAGGLPRGNKPYAPPHHLARQVHHHNIDLAYAHHERQVRGEPAAPFVAQSSAQRVNVDGGGVGKPKKPLKDWTEYETWDKLAKDGAAFQQYWDERNEARRNLPENWTAVREEAQSMLEDDREWAGLINIVGGVPVIVEKVASPTAIGEGVGHNTAAMVPVKTMEKLARRPAMYIFHTHPQGTSPLLSPTDVASSLIGGYSGRYAGDVMISPSAITLSGPTSSLIDHIWDNPHPHFAALRAAFGAFTALEALGGRGESFTINQFAALTREFGMSYIIFPTDRFAQLQYNMVFVAHEQVNITDLKNYISNLEKAQKTAYPDDPTGTAANAEDMPVEARKVEAAPQAAPLAQAEAVSED